MTGDSLYAPGYRPEEEEDDFATSASEDDEPAAWNDEDEDQAWANGEYDEQVREWRANGVSEEEIQARAGRYYKPPATPRLQLLRHGDASDEPTDLTWLKVMIRASWSAYDPVLPGYQAAALMLDGRLATDGSVAQQRYLQGIGRKMLDARKDLTDSTGFGSSQEKQMLMRAGFAWVVLPMRHTTMAGVGISAVIGGPNHRHTHAALDCAYGVALSVLGAASAIDCSALREDTQLWLCEVETTLPTLYRSFREIGMDLDDYEPYTAPGPRKSKRTPKPRQPRKPRSTI